jgi:Sulfatase
MAYEIRQPMRRRHFLASMMASSIGGMAAEAARPNVVVILVDDMGWGDVSMNGCPDIRTPNIDSIARDGVRFTRFYASSLPAAIRSAWEVSSVPSA